MRWASAAIGMAGLLLLAIVDVEIILAIAAFVVLVLLPGVGIASVLVPGHNETVSARLAVALGLGLAFVVLLGVLLDRTPLGVGSAPAVLAATAVLAGVALAVRSRGALPALSVGRVDWTSASILGLSLVLTVAAFAVSRLDLTGSSITGSVQLWLVSTADGSLEVGAGNVGPTTARYRVVVTTPGRTVAEFSDIAVDPGARWEASLPDVAADERPVSAVLYGADAPESPIRRVEITAPDAAS